MKYSSTERKLHATQPNMHIYVLIFQEFLQILKYIRNFNIVTLRRVVAGFHKYGTNTPGGESSYFTWSLSSTKDDGS